MILLDGKGVSARIRGELKEITTRFEAENGRKVSLAVILVGDDPASQIYVRNKIKGCEEAGIRSVSYRFDADTSEDKIKECIRALAEDPWIDGILVQLPLPRPLNAERILKEIPPEKDVDGFSAENVGVLALNGDSGIVSCTPLGVMELLARYEIPIAGRRAVVVGRSNIVGRPMALLLLNADATVTVCHSKTENLKEECLRADILVSAIGKARFITADMVKKGAVVVDVGMNRDERGLCGDVDYEAVKEKASYITPVPGGVGPMTIAMLLKNTVQSALRRV